MNSKEEHIKGQKTIKVEFTKRNSKQGEGLIDIVLEEDQFCLLIYSLIRTTSLEFI